MRDFRRLVVAIGVLVVLALAAAGCAAGAGDQLHIRIRNDSAVDIKGFWLGTGSGAGGPSSRSYGEIAAGETTRYRTRQAEYGYYSNYNLVTTDGTRYLGTFPLEQVGGTQLDPGYYTFVFHIAGGRGMLEVIRDEPAD